MRRRYTTFVLLALDIVCAVGVFNLATLVRGFGLREGFLLPALIAPVGILIFALYLIDGYSPRTDMLSVDYASQHTIAVVGAMAGTLFLTYAVVTESYSLQASRLVILMSFLGLGAVSLGYRRMIYLRRYGKLRRHAILFHGDAESAQAFAAECRKMALPNPIVYTPREESRLPDGDALGRSLDEIESGNRPVEAVVLRESSGSLAPDLARRLVSLHFAGVPTYPLELFHQVYWRKIPLYRLNPTWLFQEGFKVAREPIFERLKRVSDVVLALAGLLVAAPLVIAGGIAVWLEDRGPVFFVQRRIGRNHVPFRLFKLRSMRTHSSSRDPYTRPGDQRITRTGRFLRAARVDELPQLWNVLRGDMSLIGPRAEWDLLVETYEREIPCYHFRHLVKPGITGWAQVNYPYGASVEDTIRKLEYDLYYIRHFSFTLDAAILLKTIHIVLFGRGR